MARGSLPVGKGVGTIQALKLIGFRVGASGLQPEIVSSPDLPFPGDLKDVARGSSFGPTGLEHDNAPFVAMRYRKRQR